MDISKYFNVRDIFFFRKTLHKSLLVNHQNKLFKEPSLIKMCDFLKYDLEN